MALGYVRAAHAVAGQLLITKNGATAKVIGPVHLG
jgi:hypothetical protein